MTPLHSSSYPPAARRQHPSIVAEAWSSLIQSLREMAQRHARARRIRRDIEILSRLDYEQLWDIGLTRAEIESAVTTRAGKLDAARQQVEDRDAIDAWWAGRG